MGKFLASLIILVLLGMVAGSFLFSAEKGLEQEDSDSENGNENSISGFVSLDESEDDEDCENCSAGDGAGKSVKDSSGGIDASELTEEEIKEKFPDIESVECGFYFDEYEVCGGTCPDGECVSEGRSCYCKD